MKRKVAITLIIMVLISMVQLVSFADSPNETYEKFLVFKQWEEWSLEDYDDSMYFYDKCIDAANSRWKKDEKYYSLKGESYFWLNKADESWINYRFYQKKAQAKLEEYFESLQ